MAREEQPNYRLSQPITREEVKEALRKMKSGKAVGPIIPLYKNNGDAQNCNNYRGIKLLSHTMKLWEWLIEGRLRGENRDFR